MLSLLSLFCVYNIRNHNIHFRHCLKINKKWWLFRVIDIIFPKLYSLRSYLTIISDLAIYWQVSNGYLHVNSSHVIVVSYLLDYVVLYLLGEREGIWDQYIVWENEYEFYPGDIILRVPFLFLIRLLEAPLKHISYCLVYYSHDLFVGEICSWRRVV